MKRRSLLQNSEGSVLITTALAIVLLVAVAGMSVDLGRQQLMHARLQQSADAAALAGAVGGINETSQQTAMRYFNLNFSANYQDLARPTPSIQANSAMTVSASGSIDAQFVDGVNNIATTGRSVVSPGMGASSQTFDLVLVLDNTNSMLTVDPGQAQPRITGLQSASRSITSNILASGSDSRMAAVGYNYEAPITQPLTSSAATINGFVDSMSNTQLGTDSSTGMAAAVPFIQGARNDVVRAVVLITDGENNSFGGAFFMDGEPGDAEIGRSHDTIRVAELRAASDAATIAYCTQLKNMTPPTIIYTIGYGAAVTGSESSAQQLLRSCATASATGGDNINEHVFIVPDAVTLGQAFNTITAGLGQLRITD
jgi:Flp pilus assembly protein TadG